MKNKNRGAVGIIAIIAIVVVFAIFFGGQWNNLVKLDEDVNGAWAQVQNQVKRRADLIPNVVETVKGYASHEKETFTEITKARAGISEASTPKELAEANDNLTEAIGRLNVVVENYPELKTNQNFLDLQAQLEGTENRIATERMRYNETVKIYNQKVRRFPTNIIAKILGFSARDYFEVSEKDNKVPEVKF
ncbi:LemA family protein [Peptoniphilus sp. AGMB00490]|uniref:LemA family protein n=2 Tax=Peptoniphilus TaxID=162289 RepID=A0ACD6AZ05_9FIRM|nr:MULTISPECIES: LemA family protein [Peptoniphilus]NMW86027.1 LemA family protein [Peptoniphilus faecalis]OLR64448.1 LemA family protein [Peptoniphilus porci]